MLTTALDQADGISSAEELGSSSAAANVQAAKAIVQEAAP
jgi:hypothetical protein